MNTLLMVIGFALLPVVCGLWYSYYRSVRKLREHDRETARIMQRDIDALEQNGANAESVAAARARLQAFRTQHGIRD